MALHEALGEVLAAFKTRALFARTDHRHVFLFEVVVYALHQRIFVAHDYQVDMMVGYILFYGFEVGRRYIDVGTVFCCTAVAGCYI